MNWLAILFSYLIIFLTGGSSRNVTGSFKYLTTSKIVILVSYTHSVFGFE